MKVGVMAAVAVCLAVGAATAQPPTYVMNAREDLNGDGKLDSISLVPLERLEGAFTLTVSGSSVTDRVGGRVEGFLVVDIAWGDGYKEVAVYTQGPSDDFESYYFWFNGTELHRTGKVSGWARPSGLGTVDVTAWRGFWHIHLEYRLTGEHTLELVPASLYWVGVDGPCSRAFRIYETPDGDTVAAEVRSGEQVFVVAAMPKEGGLPDPSGWMYLVKTESNQVGWMRDEPTSRIGVPVAD